MNYLAHLYLAEQTPHGLVGSLLGDFAKGSIERFPEEMQRGIRLHRRIDVYTDAHPLVVVSRARVSPERRRYAGILLDMFYDHFLARHWRDWADVPLERFAERAYEVLEAEYALLPERLQRLLPAMRRDDWLTSYRDVENIAVALERMSRRLKRENPLGGGATELEANYQAFEADFRAFFPKLVEFAGARPADSAGRVLLC